MENGSKSLHGLILAFIHDSVVNIVKMILFLYVALVHVICTYVIILSAIDHLRQIVIHVPRVLQLARNYT